MKKLILFPLLLLALFASAQIDKYVPTRPSPPKLVNDFTGTLTPQQAEALEAKLVAYDDSTSNQIAVVLIPTTGDYGVEEVALQILRRWGVGNKEHNNGIVLLIAKDDHRLRIETGYGLEGAIPDLTASSIIDNIIVPRFKGNDYYAGIDAGVDAIIKAAVGEYKAPEGYAKKKSKGFPVGSIIFIIILIFVFVGGGGGGRSGGMMSRRGYGGFTAGWIIGSLLGGGGSRGGGGWGGGGGGGGFGGGSGGGGGASGSW